MPRPLAGDSKLSNPKASNPPDGGLLASLLVMPDLQRSGLESAPSGNSLGELSANS